MLTRYPEWARKCSDCVKYVYGENGKVSEYDDQVDGKIVSLPMLRSSFVGSKPPCGVCPKHEGTPEFGRQPLPDDDDFGEWFFDLQQMYREGRAIGYGDLDPFMAAVIAEFHDADRSYQQDSLCRAIVLGIQAMKR